MHHMVRSDGCNNIVEVISDGIVEVVSDGIGEVVYQILCTLQGGVSDVIQCWFRDQIFHSSFWDNPHPPFFFF